MGNNSSNELIANNLVSLPPPLSSLRQIDVEFMRRLHQKVNLIPVIAKSDTMTDEEIVLFKQRILADIRHHQIQIFRAPVYENEDEETLLENEEIAVSDALVRWMIDGLLADLTSAPLRARSPLPSSAQTKKSTRQTVVESEVDPTRGV